MRKTLEELKEELKAISPGEYLSKDYASLPSVEQVEAILRQTKGDALKFQLKRCNPGREWKKFQNVCLELVKLTLERSEFDECVTSEELPTQFVQPDSKGMRKDIVIPLTHRKLESEDDIRTIWDEFRYKPWNCKYLIFDAKNYSGPIKHEQIYQMFHYLNPKNGRVGIIFSRKFDVDESGKSALRRIREENYMVFVLKDDDIEEWINDFIKDGHVRTFFRTLKTKFDNSFVV